MIEIENKTEKFKTKIDGIIVIVFQYFHCWGLISAYLNYICLKVFFGFMKQMNI